MIIRDHPLPLLETIIQLLTRNLTTINSLLYLPTINRIHTLSTNRLPPLPLQFQLQLQSVENLQFDLNLLRPLSSFSVSPPT